MSVIKALLISMPWAVYQLPSIQIGTLSAYARKMGFDVEALHLHLEIAALFGFNKYNEIGRIEDWVGELYSRALLFPDRKKQILNYLRRNIARPENRLKRLLQAMQKTYQNIDWGKYELIGFTILPLQLFASLLFAKWLKRDFPHIKIVFGGTGVVGQLGASVLQCFKQVDWCVEGEGEIAFTKLLKCLSNGIKNVEDCVPGLIYRSDNGININPRRQLSNLNGLPDPDYDHYFWLLKNHNRLMNKEVLWPLPIEASRGCPYHCAFCAEKPLWYGYRTRSPYAVAKQLKRMSESYRFNHFAFVDHVIPASYGERLLPLIEKQNSDFDIFFEMRANIHKSQVEAMLHAGVSNLQIGIEALSTNLLRKMNKGTRVIDNLQAMKICEEVGIENRYNLMTKFPTESQHDIDESIKNMSYATSFRPPSELPDFQLVYGSPVFDCPERYGIINIRNSAAYSRLIPRSISRQISLFVRQYDSRRKPRDYKAFMLQCNRWKSVYDEALLRNKKLLSYYDCGTFLRIEDFRFGKTVVTLEDEARQLYLFCEEIKNWKEIKKQFSNWNEAEVKKVLNKLVKLKVMFREGDNYLSLAITANRPRMK